MKVLISILFNAFTLYALKFLLGPNPMRGIEAGIVDEGGLVTYLIGGVVLGLINITIRPVLKLFSLPLFFLFFGLSSFVINGIVLKTLDYVYSNILMIEGVSYKIEGSFLSVNFLIAVAIFTILNMFYSLLFSKK